MMMLDLLFFILILAIFLLLFFVSIFSLLFSSARKKKYILLVGIISFTILVFLFLFLFSPSPMTSSPTGNIETPPPDIDTYFRKYAQEAQIIFKSSEKMKVGETEIVKVYISENTSENIRKIAGKDFTSCNITGTPKMNVELREKQVGTFEIDPITNENQIVGKGLTVWEWKVTPKQSGKQTLTLIVNYVVNTSSGESVTNYIPDSDIVTFNVSAREIEKNIEIESNPTYFVESNWQWIIGTLIALMSIPQLGNLFKKKK